MTDSNAHSTISADFLEILRCPVAVHYKDKGDDPASCGWFTMGSGWSAMIPAINIHCRWHSAYAGRDRREVQECGRGRFTCTASG